ncbi:acetate CoA-transferase subunit alpha [Clostridium sp. CM028]|uniref:acetate CoA-transferase subunit alpha n=1 Tax=unclassified Clostridium TaxID=2614128 RepID=UPI001C6ECCB3|nr:MULTISPECIES: acetate CoA-transferase subunit alpha [unclassified Clostridium]MBW9146823.1 acetate CoA-transferase subunit alpha [Clostridium sp. CM027]MBW9150156.1 acetate CoA-transferase subunit alpha [Clostridium sp. CM028]UVE39698.1 acetate CoA-transferase subunit alpha [Clostridium sp. CM027]WLC60401.1 acetate CoA-transferase subunit alpha [Clostridium sp. CM028]
MNKVVSLEQVRPLLKDGMSIMIGGFLACGTPEKMIDLLIETNVKNLTIIANDTSYVDRGIGRLVVNGQVKKVVASHIGTNAETGRLMTEGKMEVELVPQGTLIERIRAAGAGLGGVLTPTGVGTMIEEGKQKLTIEGKEYLLELPIKADLALVYASVVDEIGNAVYYGTTKNFNPIIATAAETVIVEAEKIVKIGDLDPNNIVTPCVLVDYIIGEAN